MTARRTRLQRALAALHGAERHRAYFYRLAAAVGLVLVAGGRITSGDLSTGMTLVGALLGVGSSGLAVANTSTKARR